jgi:hypothetical protein
MDGCYLFFARNTVCLSRRNEGAHNAIGLLPTWVAEQSYRGPLYSGAARLAKEPDGTGDILCEISCNALPASAWLLLSTAPATTVLICSRPLSRPVLSPLA